MMNTISGLAVQGAQALGGAAVDGVSGLLKGEMEARKLGEDKLEAMDTVTEVCKEMVPDMVGKAASQALIKMFPPETVPNPVLEAGEEGPEHV